MDAVPAEVPEAKLLGLIGARAGFSLSTEPSVRLLVGSVPVVEVPGPTEVPPALLHFSFFRGVGEGAPVATDANTGRSNFGEFVVGLSPLVPMDREVRTITIIPALTPVVAPVTLRDSVVPRFAGPATVAIATSRS